MLLYYWISSPDEQTKINFNKIQHKRGNNSGKFRIRYLCEKR